jgi:hypothetical protein
VRVYKTKIFLIAFLILVGQLSIPASASTLQLVVAEDKTTGYNRSLFKHWIDADKDGCNTRAEVLIEEAVVKPKIGPKCKLTGGEWVSAYDGKKVTNASQLDVDHLVPLAEAWRSGAWKWSAAERQAYANDLENSEALISVALATNRSKGDKDPSLWIPIQNQCNYVESWISIKSKYSLSIDKSEKTKLEELITDCSLANVRFLNDDAQLTIDLAQPKISIVGRVGPLHDGFVISVEPIAQIQSNDFDYYLIIGGTSIGGLFACSSQGTVYRAGIISRKEFSDLENFFSKTLKTKGPQFLIPLKATPINYNCSFVSQSGPFKSLIVALDKSKKIQAQSDITTFTLKSELVEESKSPSTEPSPQNVKIIPGAFCSPAGAIGNSASGVTYSCKTSPTDTRNRWRQ